MDSINGVRITVSAAMPAPGWHPKVNAWEIRRENLAALCGGGSLLDCEKPDYHSTGCVLITPPRNPFFSAPVERPYFVVHPDVKQQLELAHLRSMAPFARLQSA